MQANSGDPDQTLWDSVGVWSESALFAYVPQKGR